MININVTLDGKKVKHNAILKNNVISYISDEYIISIDFENNIIKRVKNGYELTIKLDIDNLTKNICKFDGKQFEIEIKTNYIKKDTYYFNTNYEVVGGSIIDFKLEVEDGIRIKPNN